MKSDFTDRFLGFIVKYDDFYSMEYYHIMENYISTKNFKKIRYFLRSIRHDSLNIVSFTTQKFISMSIADLEYYQEQYSKVCELSDESKCLYAELLSFYE